jgi:hypothetical protein
LSRFISIVLLTKNDSIAFIIVKRGVERLGHDTARHTKFVEELQESMTLPKKLMKTLMIKEMYVRQQLTYAQEPRRGRGTCWVGVRRHINILWGSKWTCMEILVEDINVYPQIAPNTDEGGIGGASPPHVAVTNLA